MTTLTPTTDAVALYARIIGSEHRAATHAPMQPPGTHSGKYLTVHAEITDDQIVAHIAGTETYAVNLIGRDGFARAWTVDVDEGGTAAVRARVEALSAAGLPCLGIAGQGAGEHDGGHIWGIYAAPVVPNAAKAQIKATLNNAGLPTKEIWPCGIHIRAPFGVHTHTGRRGTLIRPDVPDANLDTPEGLALGLDTLAGLKPTPTPPPLPPPTPRPTATTTLSAGEAGGSVRDVIKAFNREHPIDQLLRSYGAQHTRDGWACNCGVAHTHETQIAVTNGGNAIFFSARCAWATTRTDLNGRPVSDSFDLFTIVEHRGNKSDALRALRGKQPRPSDAERQRASRERQQQRLAEKRNAILDRAAEDAELVSQPTKRAVLAALLDGSCLWNSDLASSLSNPQLQDAVGKSKRTIQYATEWLEGRYFLSQIRGPKDTVLRIFITHPRICVTTGQATDLTIPTLQNDDCRGAMDTQNSVTSEQVPILSVGKHQTDVSRGAMDTQNSVTSEQVPILSVGKHQTDVSRGAISEVQNGALHPSTDMTGEGGAYLMRANAQAHATSPASAWETWEWSPDVGDDYGVEDAPPSPAPALVAGNDSPIAPNTDAHREWLRRAAIAPRPAPVTPERLAEMIARIRNEQTASPEPAQPEPEPALIPEQPALAPASTDSTNAPQPAPALDHRAWLRRARTTPHAAPVTPERLAEIIARLRASSPPLQPDDTPQPAPEQPHDGSGAAIEDCAAHDEKATLQEGLGATEQTLSTHSHVRDVIAPQKPVQPAHEQTIATVIARIEIARTEIRYTKQETLNRETGELVEKATKALKHRVRAIVSDVPDALFDAAWKKANDVWLTYRAKLEQCDAIGLAFAVRDTARKHADAVRKDSPRVKFYAAQSRIAAEICARRGVDPLDPTGKKKLRATQAQAKAQAKAQTERRGKVAHLLSPSVAQRPLFEYTPVACAD